MSDPPSVPSLSQPIPSSSPTAQSRTSATQGILSPGSSIVSGISATRPPGTLPPAPIVAPSPLPASASPVPPPSNGGATGVARRPSRAQHPPMAPTPPKPLSHQEALEALRAFLKERSSYDVFPVSFRLIVLDTQLKVKKALDVMLLYGEWGRSIRIR
jgi:5'-AMP-activated protein kinase regulatory gamma subunit